MTPTAWFALGLLLLPAAAVAAPCAVPEGQPVALTLPLPIEPLDLQLVPAGEAWRVAWRVTSPSWLFVRDTDGRATQDAGAEALSRPIQEGSSFGFAPDGRWLSFVDGGGEVQVQRVDASGQPGTGSERAAKPTASNEERTVAVAAASDQPWVVVERATEAGSRWWLSSVAKHGGDAVELPFGVVELAVAQAGAEGWVVWLDVEHTLRSMHLAADRYGMIVRGPTLPSNAHGLAVAATPAGPRVGWVDAAGGHLQQLHALGGGAQPIDLGADVVDLALDAQGAWVALRSAEGALQVRPAGLGACEAVAVAPRGVKGPPALGSAGGRVVVSWTAPDPNGVMRVWAAALSASGALPATP